MSDPISTSKDSAVAPLSVNRLKYLRRLRQEKFRDREGVFLAEGLRLCQEALKSSVQIREFIFCRRLWPARPDALLRRVEERHIPIREASEEAFRSFAQTDSPQGVACVVEKPAYAFEELLGKNFLVATAGIQDPGNLGTMIRAAEWFAVDGLLLSGGTVDLFNPKTVRGSMGSIFRMPYLAHLNLEQTLPRFKEAGFRIVGTLVAGGEDVRRYASSPRQIIVIGSEAHGLPLAVAKSADAMVSIPSFSRTESLNAAVAAAIILYELKARHESV